MTDTFAEPLATRATALSDIRLIITYLLITPIGFSVRFDGQGIHRKDVECRPIAREIAGQLQHCEAEVMMDIRQGAKT
jgi:hypothetical protein